MTAAADCPLAPDWPTALLAACYLVACCGLVVSALCRITHTDERTHRAVRWAFVGLGGAGLFGAASVLVGYAPQWPGVLLAVATLAVQVVAARLWLRGVPPEYRVSMTHGHGE